MNSFNSPNAVEQILTRFMGPVRKVRTLLFVRENGQERIVEDTQDQTEIGPSGSIDTVVSHEAHFYDCGHFASDSLGGRCECGALVCVRCLTHCARCGAALCPKHQKKDEEGAQILCPPCSREVKAKRRLKKAGGTVASFFIQQRSRDDAR